MVEEAEKILAAARDGDIKTLQSFRRSVPFATDSFGATALHHATRYGKLECVRWMVEKVGLKAKVKAKNGATPLHDACTQGKLLCVKFFIQECQMNPDVADNSGHTPLHLAARFGYVDIVKWMLNKTKCNPRLKTMNRMNAVHFAAAGGHLNCLEFLISSGNTILMNERATDGTTSAFIAAQNGHFPCLKYLHTVGAKFDLRSRDGMHLIHAAAQNGHLDCIGYLVANGLASETDGDSTGATPAHYASGEGHVTVLKWLSKRCDLNIKDQLGGTPLHDGSEKGQLAAIQFLVESCHLSTKLKDNSGFTPIELAEKYGHKRCHDFLREASLKANQQRAAKIMSYTLTFDKQTVEDNSGSSFLHVLKKKPRQMDPPPSPQSAKAPDLPPLDVTPEPSPSTSPIPCMIEFRKSSEWQKFNDEDIAGLPHTAEVDRSVEDQSSKREHLLDSSGIELLSPLNEEFWKSESRNATPIRNVDAYTQNAEDARCFDDRLNNDVTDEMLETAKLRTKIMNARLRNPTPSPLHTFDERSADTETRKVEEFSSQIQAARAKRSPHNTVNKNDYEILKPLENKSKRVENENIEEKDVEMPMECSDSENVSFEDQVLNHSARSSPKTIPFNSPSPAPKTLTDIFTNVAPDSRSDPKKTLQQNAQLGEETSPSTQAMDDYSAREASNPEPAPSQVKAPLLSDLSTEQDKDSHSTLSEQGDCIIPVQSLQNEVKPTHLLKRKDENLPFESLKVKETPPPHEHPRAETQQPRPNPPQLNSNLYTPTPLVQLSNRTPVLEDPIKRSAEENELVVEDNVQKIDENEPKADESEPKTDDNDQSIDEENYMTTDEESDKTTSLPRQDKITEEKVPLRQRQLQPLPHMTGMASAKKSKEEPIDQQTWATLPEWKRQVLRNRIMKEQQAELELRKQEEEARQKYAGVPAWRVPIMQREESDRRNREDQLAHLPDWKKQLILRKRAKLMN